MTETDKQEIIEELTQDIEEAKNDFNSNATSKLEEYNLNAENKIIEFNENASSYEERIETLETENERLNNDINAISVTEKAEGENITLNDTAEARFKKFGIGGNSWQETGDVTDEEGNVIGAMPSPNYISPIQNVTGNANVTVCNKNMLDTSDFEIIGSELDIKRNEDGSFTINGTNTSNVVIKLKNKIKMNGNYTLIETGEKAPVSVYTTLYKNSDLSDAITYIDSYLTARYKNFEANIVSLSQKILLSAGTYSNYTVKLMLVEGTFNLSNIGDYVEHQCQQFPFPLAEGQRLMKGDYLADDGIHHKKGQVDLGTTTNAYKSNISAADVYELTKKYLGLTNANFVSTDIKCTHFKYSTSVDVGNFKPNINSNGWYFTFAEYGTTTREDFIAWLQENHPILEYELAEEEIESYTEEQQAVYDEIKKTIHSYGEQTHIFSTNEISPIFTVEARKDMNTVISNLESMIISNASEEV